MSSIIAIADVCTDEDLEKELGKGEFARLAPDSADGEEARQNALDDLLDQMENRRHPVRENAIVDPTQLRQTVVYGACSRLYRASITTGSGDDVNSAKAKWYDRKYERNANNLRPTITGNRKPAPSSIAFSRR